MTIKQLTNKRLITPAIVVLAIGGSVAAASLTNTQPTHPKETVLINQTQKPHVDTPSDPVTTSDDSDSQQTTTSGAAKTTTTPKSSAQSTATQSVAPAAPAPEPVTVASYVKIPLGTGEADCKYTYSDGTTYQWHWQTVNPQGSWQTDGFGNNGHWVAVTQTSGSCDQSAIGTVKQ